MIAVDDAHAVRLEAFDRTNNRAGGDDDVLRIDRLGLAILSCDCDLAGQRQLARAFEDRDLILLHQKLDALRVLGHDPLFALLHVGERELNV